MDKDVLKYFAQSVRESTIKRLEKVPQGCENWRITKESMSIAEIGQHLLETDEWLMEKIENPKLKSIKAEKINSKVKSRIKASKYNNTPTIPKKRSLVANLSNTPCSRNSKSVIFLVKFFIFLLNY